jgi:hypothetical protein
MPLWGWIAVAAAAVLLVAAGVVAAIFGLRALKRRTLLQLVVRAEAVEAAGKALEDSVRRLASADDSELELFADDPESPERRIMAEVATRGRVLKDELDRMPVTRDLIEVAESLADAAYLVVEQAERVRDEDRGPQAFDRLGEVNLKLARQYTEKARLRVLDACDACGLEETAVYGGGLYL